LKFNFEIFLKPYKYILCSSAMMQKKVEKK
jgi:hypothetical protein